MVNLLKTNNVNVIVINHAHESLPDAVFPNNWFSTDYKGNIIIYPLLTANRREEKDIQQVLPCWQYGYKSRKGNRPGALSYQKNCAAAQW